MNVSPDSHPGKPREGEWKRMEGNQSGVSLVLSILHLLHWNGGSPQEGSSEPPSTKEGSALKGPVHAGSGGQRDSRGLFTGLIPGSRSLLSLSVNGF